MLPRTEELHALASGLQHRPLGEVAAILAAGQVEAAQAVAGAISAICGGARAMADSLRGSGRLVYVGAGSSGLMAAADAMELGGTFGIPAARLRILMAGGLPRSAAMPGDVEDDVSELETALADLAGADTVIAASASGATPYTLAAAEIARSRGATVVGLANNAASPLLTLADHPVFLATPPEVLSGSTRMGAGTAQKIALNTLSTLMAVELGHVHDGMMVNVLADNDKLRGRAAQIVQAISGQGPGAAMRALEAAGGAVKPAILLAGGAPSREAAAALLAEAEGHLSAALSRLSTLQDQDRSQGSKGGAR